MYLPAFLNSSFPGFKLGSSGSVYFIRIGACEKEQVFSDQLLNGKSLQCWQKQAKLVVSASWSFCIFLCKAADLFPIVCPHCHFSLLPLFFFQDPQHTYGMHVNLRLDFLLEQLTSFL